MLDNPSNILDIEERDLEKLIRSIISGSQVKLQSSVCLNSTYIALRKKGILQQSYWRYDRDLKTILEQTISQALEIYGLASIASARGIDTIELCFTYNYQLVEPSKFKRIFSNVYRGIRGIELQYQDTIKRYSPTSAIARNLSFKKIWESFLKDESISAETFARKGGVIQTFDAQQILIKLTPEITVTTLHRGNRIFGDRELSKQEVSKMVETMANWLLRQIQEDGRMTYKYFPSRGQESSANNLIRQFMATLSLIRYAKFTNRPDCWILAGHNLNYNLKKFYRREGEIGAVEYEGKIKLGAVSLAALAILEYSERDGKIKIDRDYAEIFDRLCKCIDLLWQPDGSFRTFYQPGDRNDNQNFYPGEALLFWASLYQKNRDPNLLEKCYKSFNYYRNWHRNNPNPAFIPWHTQAYTLLYNATKDSQFLEFIWEMNDWLLSMQEWNGAKYQDLQGRFYNRDRPEYGPPHASSTGVYLEGLADAYQLAIQTGDRDRASIYKEVIWRGIRSIRQLQFRDDIDLFYISKRSRVHGAIRTTVYDNTIRVDNVQHCLMALLKIERFTKFDREANQKITVDRLPDRSGVGSSSNLPKDLKNFRLLNSRVEIEPFLREINNNTDLWLQDTSRQNKIKVQRETNTIYLRSALKPFPPGITSSNDVHESRTTKAAEKFPQVFNWLKSFAESIDGELARATIVRLKPHGRVYRHIDLGSYYQLRDRYHLVLQSPAGSLLGAGEEWIAMQEGELWWFDNKQPHEAINQSDDWRIHLIFDILPRDRQLK